MHRRSGQASGIMPTSGIYAGKTTFASTLPLPLSPSLLLSFSFLSLSVCLFHLTVLCLTNNILSFSSLFFLLLPPYSRYRSHSLDLFPSFCLFRSWPRCTSSSFFNVPLPVFCGMRRSIATPTSLEFAESGGIYQFDTVFEQVSPYSAFKLE